MQLFSAIGMLEFTSISAGIQAADAMIKSSGVSVLFLKTICPGKFLAAVHGDVSAVETSVRAGRQNAPAFIADGFVIPNIHNDVVKAFGGCAQIPERGALGVIETFSVASAVLAADAAAKAAAVRLLDIRTALGLGGKGCVLFTGDVGAVAASVAAGRERASESGLLVGTAVLPRPACALFTNLL